MFAATVPNSNRAVHLSALTRFQVPGRCPILIGASGVGKSSVAQADAAHLSKQIELALFYDGCRGERMTVTKSNFAFRIDRWDNKGNAIEHVAWIEDFDVALGVSQVEGRS